MSIAKELAFDLVSANFRGNSQQDVFRTLAQQLSSLKKLEESTLLETLNQNLQNGLYALGEGVAVFEITSPLFKNHSLSLLKLSQDVDFKGIRSPIRILALVLSPNNDVSSHLRRLATMSRILKSQNLCEALYDAKDEDAIRALFMPSHDLMLAA